MATEHPAAEVEALIAKGWELADDNLTAQAQLLTAEAFNGAETDPATADLVERALGLSRRVGDRRTESAALDQLTAMQLARGEVRAAATSAMRRTETPGADAGDGDERAGVVRRLVMATECQLAAGDLPSARRLAERLQDLPFCREEGHLATARLLVVAVLSGDWSEAVGLAERFREGWERAGRPQVGNLRSGAYAAATMYGLRGDDDARAAWLEIVEAVRPSGRPIAAVHVGEFFDALLLLHRGLPDQAMHLMTTPPEDFTTWYAGMWRPWYAAVWAEAAVLTESPETTDRVRRARVATADNPIATALVDRAAALTTTGGDRDSLTIAAAALQESGCRYQWARTLDSARRRGPGTGRVLAGGHGGHADGLATPLRVDASLDDDVRGTPRIEQIRGVSRMARSPHRLRVVLDTPTASGGSGIDLTAEAIPSGRPLWRSHDLPPQLPAPQPRRCRRPSPWVTCPTLRSPSPTCRSACPGTSASSVARRFSTRTPGPSATSSSPSAAPCSACTQFPATVDDNAPFDPHRPGLDHVSFGCPDRITLAAWATRLDHLGIAHGGIVDAGYGSGLSFKDPDGLPLEVFCPPNG